MLNKSDQLSKNKPKKFRVRKCKECKRWFTPERERQEVCNEICAELYLPTKMAKDKRKAIKQFRETDKAVLIKVAQQVFNKYIRKRDELLPCISCGHTGNRQRHAGHFRPTGRNAQLRFNEDNCHSQCSICNNHLSGNLVQYRDALTIKIGTARVAMLEKNNTPKNYTVSELQDLIKTYKEKYKKLV